MQIIFLKKFKVTIIKIQNRTVKEVITKWKGSLLNERTYTSAPSDKGLTSQICKELIQIHIKNINNPIWKWAENLNRNTDGQRTCKKIFGMVNHQWNANESHNEILCTLFLVTQSCLTLCDPMDCSPPGSSGHGDSTGKNTGVGSLSLP